MTMRVLLFTTADLRAAGGTPIRTRLLALALRLAGAEVAVVSPGLPDELHAAGIGASPLDLSREWTSQLAAAADRWQPHALLGVTEAGADGVADIARRHGVPLVFDLHGIGLIEIMELGRGHGSRWARVRSSARWLRAVGHADLVTSANPMLTRYLRTLVNRRTVPLVGITDLERFAPRPRTSDGDDRIRVLFAGSFFRWQGLDLLMEAIRSLGAEARQIQFTVLGSIGRDAGQIAEWERQLPGTVRFVHGVAYEQIAPIYNDADVLVIPRRWMMSTHLAFPQKLPDGMAAARAIVATDLAPHRWALKPGTSGLLCQPRPDALATALLACRDAALRRELGAGARLRATELFCHRRQGARLLELLDEVAGRRRARARPAVPARPRALRDRDFPQGPVSGRTRVLFVGLPQSSHTHAWIDLFPRDRFDVRLFSTSSDVPPAAWAVNTYIAPGDGLLEAPDRINIRNAGVWRRYLRRAAVGWVERLHARRMRQLARELRRRRVDGVVVCGAGQAGAALIDALHAEQIHVARIVDSNPALWGGRLRDVSIHSLATAIEAGESRFAIGSFAHQAGITDAISRACMEVRRDCEIFAPRTSRADDWVRAASRLAVRAAYARRPVAPPWSASSAEAALASVVASWRPDIVHTLGLDAARQYLATRRAWPLVRSAYWVVQLRGGADLMMARFAPGAESASWLEVLNGCDEILTDNLESVRICAARGVDRARFSPVVPVPGTGGVDLDLAVVRASDPPSRRRAIVWPKAYECPWSKALPVLEALSRSWARLPDCTLHLLATGPEVRMWVHALAQGLQQRIVMHDRIDRAETLRLMQQARVMLAPSLVDGVPNVLYEAMAHGAVPIVSPISTLTSIVRDGDHVLFARNLYPDEIATALVRAMTDDQLVDGIAARNLDYVRQLADRARVSELVCARYESIATGTSARRHARAGALQSDSTADTRGAA